MHIYVSKLTITDSGNGLSPGWHQAIIWSNGGLLLIGLLGTNLIEILIEINTFSFRKMHLKMLSGKWRPFCLTLNVLRETWIPFLCERGQWHERLSPQYCPLVPSLANMPHLYETYSPSEQGGGAPIWLSGMEVDIKQGQGWGTKRACHPGGHSWDHYPGVLYFKVKSFQFIRNSVSSPGNHFDTKTNGLVQDCN